MFNVFFFVLFLNTLKVLIYIPTCVILFYVSIITKKGKKHADR